MKIKICCSETMTDKKETELIRIPKSVRDKLDIGIQSIVAIESPGLTLRLRVRHALKEDLGNNLGEECFVSKHIYDLLFDEGEGKAVSIADVQPFNGMTLGCDPECFILNMEEGGRIELASHVIKKMTKGAVPNGMGIRLRDYGYVGWDGAKTLMEFRPDPVPAEQVNLLLRNLAGMVDFCKNRLPVGHRIYGNTYRNKIAAGFHLHFGLPDVYITGKGIGDEEEAPVFMPAVFNSNHILMSKLIYDVLNYFIGVPLLFSDTEQNYRVWNSVKYGRYNDGLKIHQYTLEYRIPGAGNLKSPLLTNNLVSASTLIVRNMVSLFEEITDGYKRNKIDDTATLEKAVNHAFGLKDVSKTRKIIDRETVPTEEERVSIINEIGNRFSKLNGFDNSSKSFIDLSLKKAIDATNPDMINNWEGVL